MKNKTSIKYLIEKWPILESQIPSRIIESAEAIEIERLQNIKRELDEVVKERDYYIKLFHKAIAYTVRK